MRRVMVVLVFLSGCLGGRAPGVDEQAIIGGTDDNSDPAVVAIYAQVPGAAGGSLCTGEIVSPHVVMTAAHCVSPQEVGAGAQFTVLIGSDVNQPLQRLAVQETHFDTQWSLSNLPAGHDIGVVILAQPTSITPLAMNRTAVQQTDVSKPVRLVGFGLNSVQPRTGAGLKRQTMTTLAGFDSLLLSFTDPTHGTCNGDSGGPALMDLGAGEVIAGVTSYGDSNCTQGFDTRVDAMAGFVDPYVQSFDPSLPPPPPPTPSPDLGQAPAPTGADMGGPAGTATVDRPPATPNGNNAVMGGCQVGGTPDLSLLSLVLCAVVAGLGRRRQTGLGARVGSTGDALDTPNPR